MLGYFHCISCVPPRRFRRQPGPTEKGTVNLDYLNNYCISTRHVRQLPWKINRGVSGFTADQIVRWGFRMDAVVIPYPMATWLYGRREKRELVSWIFLTQVCTFMLLGVGTLNGRNACSARQLLAFAIPTPGLPREKKSHSPTVDGWIFSSTSTRWLHIPAI